jgi:hypothetical protein
MIDLDKLRRTWGVEIERTMDHETLNHLGRLAKALNESTGDDHLPDEAYRVVCGWGKARREELSK